MATETSKAYHVLYLPKGEKEFQHHFALSTNHERVDIAWVKESFPTIFEKVGFYILLESIGNLEVQKKK